MNEGNYIYRYILLSILLLLSFYFSGSETAIFSLNRLERNSLKKTKSKSRRRILSFLMENQEQLLISILTGNMIVNIFASSLGSEIGEYLFEGSSELFSIIGMTLLLLLLGELTPKRIAVNHSKGFTRLISVPLYYIHHFLFPVRFVLNHFSGWILNIFPSHLGDTKEDKHALVLSTAELGYNQDILKDSEYHLFKSYLAFKDKTALGVMTPRNELKTLSCELSIREVLENIASDPEYVVNSSIILFKEDIDHLYGWVPISDIIKCKFGKESTDDRITTLSRKFYIVPDSKDLPTLILELRDNDMDLVLLVDEYGGTAGVVWFRNIIEDVLKAFYSPRIKKLSREEESSIVVPGSMSIEELEEYLGINIDLDVVTAAGFFLEIFGEVPVSGDEILYSNIRFTVLNMEINKITTLQIEIEPEP